MTERIGFIGLGAMGKGMALNLQNKGFQLNVFDIAPEPVAILVQQGAVAAASVAELTQNSDIVVTMLPGSPEVDGVVLGEGGVLAEPGMRQQRRRQHHPALAVEGEGIASGQQRGGEIAVRVGEGIEGIDALGDPLQAVHAASLDRRRDRRGIGDDAVEALLGQDGTPTGRHRDPALPVDLVVETRKEIALHQTAPRRPPSMRAG